MDLRERAVAAVVAEGWTQTRAAEVYGLSEAGVSRFVAARREPLEAPPDLELVERGEHLAQEEGICLGVATLWRELRALGWTREKRAFERQRTRPPRTGSVALAGHLAFACA